MGKEAFAFFQLLGNALMTVTIVWIKSSVIAIRAPT